MRFEKTIKISKEEANQINKHLQVEPTCAEECLGEDIAIVHTAKFDNGLEMDIKCCGVQYNEDEESNTAWTEAVLFENSVEVCCTEPEDEYLGEWVLEYDGHEYVVHVEMEEPKQYWVSAIIQEEYDRKAWLSASYGCDSSLEDAMAHVESYRKNHKVLAAWIDITEDGKKTVVYHECYMNCFGDLNK